MLFSVYSTICFNVFFIISEITIDYLDQKIIRRKGYPNKFHFIFNGKILHTIIQKTYCLYNVIKQAGL